ncbi:Gfo/Idh/MocA family oxidoreductase [Acidimicrobiia bacterium]|nr:Gfo/Idh/MocA family oxidoreductase [Acidimicrobiia bacterium]
MKKVLIVGFGNHAQRRILPALKSINQIDDIAVTSRSNKKNYTDEIVYLNKDDILNSDIFFDAIIISSYPNVHIDNLKEFKNKSNSFLIEKPVTNYLDYLESSEYFDFHNNYAARECLMYFHHPIYRKFQEIINSDKIEAISASFKIPHIESNNFRYSKALGGSAILDQGVYPISLILENFKLIENSIDSSIGIQDNQSIDSSGYLSCKSEGGVEININWGIGFDYSNFVEVISNDIIYSFPMFFSKPENFLSIYKTESQGKEETVVLGTFDQFKIMYEDMIINQKEFSYNSYDNLCKRYNFIRKLLNDKIS